MNRYRVQASLFLALGGVMILAGTALMVSQPLPVRAQDDATSASSPTGDDSYCLVCHAQPDQMYTLADGTTFEIAVDPQDIADSVHGAQSEAGPLGCIDCHDESVFPHTQPLPISRRAYTAQQSATICATCHEEQTAELVDSVHYRGLAEGNLSAATCVDCHGAHDVQPARESPQNVAFTCGNCHAAVFQEYEHSVHGEALIEGDPNVPTCTNCHGVHGIQNPTSALFRNRSPELCAGCHADAELMAQYDITTNVFESYLTDFHGTTVALFEQQDPNVPTNKAVCMDCHGVHDITPSDAEHSRVIRENLLDTCQQCHPGATSDFPDAWVGHFPPTAESHPLLFVVTLFYNILIPVTVGGFIFLIATDIFRRIRGRRASRG
jgi:predicted CXXCH cytochrome family protein